VGASRGARCLVPKLVLNGFNSYFLVWGQFCGVHLFLALLHGVTLQTGWMQPQMVMKNCFLSDLLEPRELPFFSTAKSCSPDKPVSDGNRQKKNKNHFWPIQEHTCAPAARLH
jgi:hypothetical protein